MEIYDNSEAKTMSKLLHCNVDVCKKKNEKIIISLLHLQTPSVGKIFINFMNICHVFFILHFHCFPSVELFVLFWIFSVCINRLIASQNHTTIDRRNKIEYFILHNNSINNTEQNCIWIGWKFEWFECSGIDWGMCKI